MESHGFATRQINSVSVANLRPYDEHMWAILVYLMLPDVKRACGIRGRGETLIFGGAALPGLSYQRKCLKVRLGPCVILELGWRTTRRRLSTSKLSVAR